MSLKRKVIKMEIEEKEYDLILDFESAIEFQDMSKKSIFEGIQDISEKQDLKVMAMLIASCLKDENGCVGMDFVMKLDLMEFLPKFMEKLGELMSNSLPTEDNKKTKGKK